MTERSRRLWPWLLVGLLLGLLVVAGALLGFTNTNWGRERLLAYTLSTLADRVQGELLVERLDGNLLTGARLYGVALYQPDGEPFVLADSAFVDYRIPSLLGDVTLEYVVLFNAEVLVRKLPGDTLWNYQQIFADTSAARDTTGPGRITRVQSLQLYRSLVTVQTEWTPEEELPPAARDSAVEAALSDTSRILVSRVPSGLLRTYRFENTDAALSSVTVAPDELGGVYVRVDSVSTQAYVWRDPLLIRSAEGELSLREGLLLLDIQPIRLPNSRLAVIGAIRLPDGPRYDLLARIEGVAFSDIQPLYPRLPEEGGLEARLTLESRPDGLLVRIEDLNFEAPGTVVTGSAGLVVGDTLRFLDADLVADPLRLETIEQLLPTDIPVQGLRIGAAEIGTTS